MTLKNIQEIMDSSSKAELCEKLADVLSVEGSKVAIITGLPNDVKGLDIRILQYGFKYDYELMGFIGIAQDVADGLYVEG